MNVRSIIALLALLFFCQSGAMAASEAPKPTDKAGPTIRFLRPMRNEKFFDYPIFIQVEVLGFDLKPPEVNEVAKPPRNTGHINYCMDDLPIYVTDDTQIMIGKRLGNIYVPAGVHFLKAELVDVNNKPLNPPVEVITEFATGHPAVNEVAHTTNNFGKPELNAEEIYQMRVHLEQMQKELEKIKTGNSGFSPTPVQGSTPAE